MDIKSTFMGLFLLKEFSPVMGVAVLASLLWWGADPGLLWHADMAPFESYARHWFGLEGGWAQFGRWGLTVGAMVAGAFLLVPLGLIGFAAIALAFMAAGLALMAVIYCAVLPPIFMFVFWMYTLHALRVYVLRLPGIKEYEDLTNHQWLGLAGITAVTYLIVIYWVVVRFIP